MDWFTADTHFGHGNIIRYCNRPFANSNEMDDHLIDQINSNVNHNDTLWHLGDFSFRNHEKYRQKIKCKTINIIWGNHDRCPLYVAKRNFSGFWDFKEIKIRNTKIILCHYAMAVWNKSHHGSWQLYGHSHSNAEEWMDKNLPERKSIDVGVDNVKKVFGEYRPVSFDELSEFFSKKRGSSIDHHENHK